MKILAFFLVAFSSFNIFAARLSEMKPFNFEVLFTNPVCKTYKYNRPVITTSGKTVDSKPQDVYCKQSDEAASVSRKNSPQYRLVEWISGKDAKEIYLAYLSFSAKNVVNALCEAVKRGVKLKIVLDGDGKSINRDAENLKKCHSQDLVEVHYRGSTGGLGYAHNKIMIVNPDSSTTKIVFSSGNMTSGTSTNHENWNFVTTTGQSYFAQAHKCAIEGMIEAGDAKRNFSAFMKNCRDNIKAQPETDIKVFFSPVDGKAALLQVQEAGKNANLIESMSHRFSGAIAELYANLLKEGKHIKFILDDDVYWSATLNKDIGRNTRFEAYKIFNELVKAGMETRFLETNQNVYQLQHNKFMIFTFNQTGAVFNGAGNFTTAAFTKNFENFYYIEIPSVVSAYKVQFKRYFDGMATQAQDMPRDYVMP